MPEYHNPQIEKAHELNERAAEMEHEGTEARHTAEEYVRATVLSRWSCSWSHGPTQPVPRVRIATLYMELALSPTPFDIATLPRL